MIKEILGDLMALRGDRKPWPAVSVANVDVNPIGCDKDLDLRIKTWADTLGVCREDKSRKVSNDCQN